MRYISAEILSPFSCVVFGSPDSVFWCGLPLLFGSSDTLVDGGGRQRQTTLSETKKTRRRNHSKIQGVCGGFYDVVYDHYQLSGNYGKSPFVASSVAEKWLTCPSWRSSLRVR